MARDLVYEKQRRKLRRALIGKKVEKRKKIVRLGRPIDGRTNAPPLVPVKLSDGTFRILWNSNVMFFPSTEINLAIWDSRKMPEVAPGIAGDVLHITAYPRKKGIKYAFIRTFYNFKEGRPDEIRYVSAEA